MSDRGVFHVLTFNVGLLEIKVGPYILDEVLYREDRLPAIVSGIHGSGADVVFLQEVFKREHFERLTQDLRDPYPYATRHDNTGRIGVGHGLLILSKYPMSGTSFTRFLNAPRHENFFIRRGFLAATISPWGASGAAIHIVNLHATSGGRLGTEAPATNRFRNAQLKQVHQAVVKRGGPTLVCGDLNAGPEASLENYETFLSYGYEDALRLLPSGLQQSDGFVTWDPTNELVEGSGFEQSPPQRVDHVFLNIEAKTVLKVASARLLFEEAAVPVENKKLTISDHYGLLVGLAKR